MGKISPFGILGETYSNAFRWIHLFMPIALVTAIVGTALNMYFMESVFSGFSAQDAAAFPENFWTIWAVMMLGMLTIQMVQMSLYDAVMERQGGWLSFGITRALRRLIPAIIGMIIFMLAYMVGLVLLIIPGLMALFLLYMMTPLILLDDVGPFEAVRKSWNLTWGNAWRLFGAVVVTFLPLILVFWIAGFALGYISPDQQQPLMGPFLSWSDWQTWVWIVLTGILGMLVTSFYLVTFKALKVAKSEDGDAVSDTVSA